MNKDEWEAAALKSDIYLFTRVFFNELNKKKWVRGNSNADHFEIIANKLNSILAGTHPTNNIIFNIPPRHGKTEMAMINFAALGFAINPESEFMHLSNSDSLITRNVLNIRRIMESPLYRKFFSNVKIVNNAKGSIMTTAGGVMYAAPFLGQITGFGCGKINSEKFAGALLIDDPIKTQDALSEQVREKINFAWANTIISRKNDKNTPVIVTAQRVHVHDFCGALIEAEGTVEEGGKWDVVKLPAITFNKDGTETPLWESRIPLEELKKINELDSWVFETQYQQDPKPISGLLFPENETNYFSEIPTDPEYIHCQVDPADEGKDCYCSKIYYVKNKNVFLVDVIYSKDNIDLTMPRQIAQIVKFKPSYIRVESNSAWRLVARELRQRLADLGLSCEVQRFNSTINKEIRIFNEAPAINKFFYYLTKNLQTPEYAAMMRERHSYVKNVKDQRDDGVDCDAAASNFLKNNNIINII